MSCFKGQRFQPSQKTKSGHGNQMSSDYNNISCNSPNVLDPAQSAVVYIIAFEFLLVEKELDTPFLALTR